MYLMAASQRTVDVARQWSSIAVAQSTLFAFGDIHDPSPDQLSHDYSVLFHELRRCQVVRTRRWAHDDGHDPNSPSVAPCCEDSLFSLSHVFSTDRLRGKCNGVTRHMPFDVVDDWCNAL